MYPKWSKKHDKTHLDLRVEALIQDALHEYNHGKWSQMTGAYEEFKRKCFNQNLKPATYKILKKEIR